MRFLTALLLAAVALPGALTAQSPSAFEPELTGRRIPSFTLPDSRRVYHDILDYRGQVVLVEVMQTHCPHCQSLAERLEAVQTRFAGKLRMLAIVLPPDTADTVRTFVERYHVRYPVLFDCGQATAALLMAGPENPRITFPHVFLVDRQGMITDHFDGVKEQAVLDGPEFIDRIEKALNAPSTAKAPAKAAPKLPAKKAN